MSWLPPPQTSMTSPQCPPAPRALSKRRWEKVPGRHRILPGPEPQGPGLSPVTEGSTKCSYEGPVLGFACTPPRDSTRRLSVDLSCQPCATYCIRITPRARRDTCQDSFREAVGLCATETSQHDEGPLLVSHAKLEVRPHAKLVTSGVPGRAARHLGTHMPSRDRRHLPNLTPGNVSCAPATGAASRPDT